MALPSPKTPVYELTVPSTGKKVKYRPFLVKEEKALRIAEQSEELSVMVDTLKTVIRDCTFGALDPDELAVFDHEYIMLQLRSKSIGETVEFSMGCDESKEHARVNISVDVSELQVKTFPGHSKTIPLFDDVGVVMRYPGFDLMKFLTEDMDDDEAMKSMVQCIDYVYEGDEIHRSEEQTVEDLVEFIDNLLEEQFDKIKNFFETMPRMELEVKYKCPTCGKHHEKTVRGIGSFF